MAIKKKFKLELFPLLKHISTKNVGYYKTLPEDSAKEFVPFIVMRWLTGSNNGTMMSAKQVYFLNELVNPYAFEFTRRDNNHKELLYNLMTISCTGKNYRYTFNKVKKSECAMPLSTKVIQEVFDYNARNAEAAIVLLDNPAIISMAEQLGRQEGELKELKKELRTKRPK